MALFSRRALSVVCLASAFGFVAATLCSLNAEDGRLCPSFEHYAHRLYPLVDESKFLTPNEKAIVKIDKSLRQVDIEEAFECVMQRRAEEIKLFFAGDKIEMDLDLYQFNFSDYAYGRIFVNAKYWDAYKDERAVEGMKVLKITFDFDASGRVVLQDVFSALVGAGGVITFSEFQSGSYRESPKCVECHRSKGADVLMFKSRFTGHKFRSEAR